MGKSICNCWQPCNEIRYDIERTVLSRNISNLNRKGDGFEYTRLEFQFKHFEFKVMKREQLHGDLDYIADIGELLSLFIGTSVLSVIELIFFFTFGFIKHIRQKTDDLRVDFDE